MTDLDTTEGYPDDYAEGWPWWLISMVIAAITLVVVLFISGIYFTVDHSRSRHHQEKLEQTRACRTVEDPTAKASCIVFSAH